jgi:hypothetical protein
MLCCVVALRSCFQNSMFMAWHGHSMACVNQTRPHCVNKMGKTQSKPLAEWHGRGTAWYVWISLYSPKCKTVLQWHKLECVLWWREPKSVTTANHWSPRSERNRIQGYWYNNSVEKGCICQGKSTSWPQRSTQTVRHFTAVFIQTSKGQTKESALSYELHEASIRQSSIRQLIWKLARFSWCRAFQKGTK